MVQVHKKIDQLTLTLIAGVAVLHVWALNPIGWMRDDATPEDEVAVVIEVAANRPMASTQVPATAATPKPRPLPSSSDTSADASPPPAALSRAAAPATQGADVPSTNATYEVSSTKHPRPP